MELSLDDPHISVESDDVINGKRNAYFKKRKKLKCSATSNIDRNTLLNECGERCSGEEEYNTQEQRTPTKRKRNVYFADTINININHKNNNDNDSNRKTNNDNDQGDIGIREAYTSSSRKLSDEEKLKNTDMVRKPYFHHKHILFELLRNIRKYQHFFHLILSYFILSYFILSYLILRYLTLSYVILSYLTLHYLI